MATKIMLAVRKNVFEDEMLLYTHVHCILLTIICFRALTIISVADLHGGSGGLLEHHSGKNISLGNL